MKWDFDSSFIPFVSRFAPSDTFKIWKYKDCLRVDSTLANFKKFKAKRRDMSLIFNPNIQTNPLYESSAPLFSLYRNKKQYTNILEEIDSDEKELMVKDLLRANSL